MDCSRTSRSSCTGAKLESNDVPSTALIIELVHLLDIGASVVDEQS